MKVLYNYKFIFSNYLGIFFTATYKVKIIIMNTVKVNIVHLYHPNAEIRRGNKTSEKQMIRLMCPDFQHWDKS